MQKMKAVGLLIPMSFMALMFTSCAKPPMVERNDAESARNTAIAAQAETYAADTMNAGEKLWNDAETKMHQKAYTAAKETYLAAKAEFVKAAVEVEAGKKALAEENKSELKSLEQKWNMLNKAAAKRAKKWKADLKKAWAQDSTKIKNAIKKAQDKAVDLADVKKELAEAHAAIAKWLDSLTK